MISIRRESKDRLKCNEWRFWYDERIHTLVLDSYTESARPTTRHKLMAEQVYNRLRHRRDNPDTAPVLPEDVAAEAKEQFCTALKVDISLR